jgi:hypothetical protein
MLLTLVLCAHTILEISTRISQHPPSTSIGMDVQYLSVFLP